MELIRVPLEDHIIAATDEDDNELLRLGLKIEGQQVLIRFPTLSNWNNFYSDFLKLMLMIAKTAGDVELDNEQVPKEHFQQWSMFMVQTLTYRECQELVGKMFFDYLRPDVPDLKEPDNQSRKSYIDNWLRNNMGMDALFYMFVAIYQIESWLKKKAIQIVAPIYPNLMTQLSEPTSPVNSTPPPPEYPTSALYALD